MALPDCSHYRPRQPRATPLCRLVAARFDFLAREGLVTPERIELLLSWRHSGFSVHHTVTVAPDDGAELKCLARYLLRAPVILHRLAFDEEAGLASYPCRPGCESFTGETACCDAAELLARVLIHIPKPRRHLVRYYGAYSSVVRARRRAVGLAGPQHGAEDTAPTDPDRRALRRLWAAMIRRMYEVDPLVCPRCGGSSWLRLRRELRRKRGAAKD